MNPVNVFLLKKLYIIIFPSYNKTVWLYKGVTIMTTIRFDLKNVFNTDKSSLKDKMKISIKTINKKSMK